MDWSDRFSGINPLEHVWDILQRWICDRPVQPLTKEGLKRAPIEEWAQIPHPAIRKLIRSFNFRCRAIITARGGHTRY